MNDQKVGGNAKANLLSLNVHGIRTYFKRKKVFSWLTKKNADIILLQETYSTKDKTNGVMSGNRGNVFSQMGLTIARGSLF